ncbi:hypothetical protein [Paenibacillus aceti]|uniref:AP2 domain-containing protein n=1 Tax=Paenibacillus aceti TaxID=1820010 RepID=A0ABQ1VPG7_9BACL|nr:hypothetical protein [Paenibacillus aceti]GGF87095.1 hypothetical protein GCM10010913_05710 [Paenibacillus aceti]
MARKLIDLTDERYGRLIVLKEAERKGYTRRWLCKCDCGEERIISQAQLRSGKTTSCGCYNRERSSQANIVDLVGERFGRLVVLEDTHERFQNKVVWLCQCDCGSDPIKVPSTYLTTGDTTSCGCLRRENGSKLQDYNEKNLRTDGVFTPLLKSKLRSDNSTGVKGVAINKKNGKYRAYLRIKGKQYYLKEHFTLEQAEAARRVGEEKLHRPYLEVPDEDN